MNHVEKGNCQVCELHAIQTILLPKHSKFKNQNIQNSQNVVHVLKYRKYGVGLYGGKTKSKFGARFDNCKSVYKLYRKKPESITQTFLYLLVQQSHNEIDAWQFALTEICETYDQCKEREHLSNTGIKHLTPVGFMKRKNIYIKSSFLRFT